MLTLYLPFKGQPRRHPLAAEVTRWIEGLLSSSLIAPLSDQSEARLEELKQLNAQAPTAPLPHAWRGPEGALMLSPGLGVQRLFDEDAREQLLPAELTFEQLRLELAPTPTLLPLGEPELEVTCRRCGDEVAPERFERALRSLQLIPLEEMRVSCLSCDAPLSHKQLTFDPEVAFASAWLTLEECGSSRLNPAVVRAWSEALGAPLTLIIEQRDAQLDWAGGDEQTLAGLEGLMGGAPILSGELSLFEQGFKPSRALRGRAHQKGSTRTPSHKTKASRRGERGGRSRGWRDDD